ncbi:hypothetical protein CEXT_290861 [Caerostris extrusa]|uniref:Uncharacterized protein n=1 Tax=Caerostris extrusa TaxID=172846 RepID=A0AAV4U5M1_CAEEX|nr:hypothetical protein CEXT_290861 [Caerostris extrusa]
MIIKIVGIYVIDIGLAKRKRCQQQLQLGDESSHFATNPSGSPNHGNPALREASSELSIRDSDDSPEGGKAATSV